MPSLTLTDVLKIANLGPWGTCVGGRHAFLESGNGNSCERDCVCVCVFVWCACVCDEWRSVRLCVCVCVCVVCLVECADVVRV